MNSQDLDVRYVQNPAIGAALLWRFVCGYYQNESHSVQFPLLFIVLPITFRQDLCAVVNSTYRASGLSKVSEKLFDKKENDSIHFINNTASILRPLTLGAFNIAVETNLLSLIPETAMVFPVTTKMSKYIPKGDTKDMLKAAEKLGAWCSDLTILEISKWLKVRF
jgi:hypothetical protein